MCACDSISGAFFRFEYDSHELLDKACVIYYLLIRCPFWIVDDGGALIKYLWLKKTYTLHLISILQEAIQCPFTPAILSLVHYSFLVFVLFIQFVVSWYWKKKQSKLRLPCGFSFFLNRIIWGQHVASSNHFLLFTCGFLSIFIESICVWKLTWHTSSTA